MKNIPPMLSPRLGSVLAGAIIAASLVPAEAADSFKANNSDDLNTSSSWVDFLPGVNDVAVWDGRVANGQAALGGPLSWQGIRVTTGNGAATGVITITGEDTLTLGTSGINMGTAGRDLTLQSAVSVGSAQAWNVAVGRILTVSGALSGANAVIKSGTGALVLSGNNSSFSGGINWTAGNLFLANASALGTGTLAISSTGRLDNVTSSALTLTTNNAQTWGANFQFQGTNDLNLGTGAVSLTGTRTVDITAKTLTVGGVISSGGSAFGLNKTGEGTLALGSVNTYTGANIVLGGKLAITKLADGGVASSIGASSASAGNLKLRSTLLYQGSGDSTDRLFTIDVSSASRTATIESSGTGALEFTNTGQLGTGDDFAGTLILGGTNTDDNTLAPIIRDRAAGVFPTISLTKEGVGKWILAGINTYTGATTLNGGTLSVGTINNGGVAGNLGAAGNVADNLVFNNGTLQYTGATASTDRNFKISNGATGTIEVTSSNLTVSGASAATSGALRKTGAGTLTLGGSNLHTGTTTIAAGTLALTSSGSLAESSGINLGTEGSQGVLDVTSKAGFSFESDQTVSGYGTLNIGTGKTVSIAGNLTPGNSTGVINVTGSSELLTSAETIMELAASNGIPGTSHDQLNISENFTYGGTLNIVSLGGYDLDQISVYDLFSFTNYSGNFSSVSVGGQALTFDASSEKWFAENGGSAYVFSLTTGDLQVIPEPSTYLLLGVGLGALVLRRRRR